MTPLRIRTGAIASFALCTLLAIGAANAQSQDVPNAGGAGGGFGEITGLPPQESVSRGVDVPFNPGPHQIDPFYKLTESHTQLDIPKEIPMTRTFNGINYTAWIPPDPIIAAGPDHLVAAVNSHVAIFTKQGVRLSLTTSTSLFGSLATGWRLFDPWVVYDQWTNRFMLLFASQRRDANNNITGARYFLAISKSSNPASGWWLYWVDNTLNGSGPTTNWADYPRLSTDRNAIYITGNMFGFGGGFKYSKIRILQSKSSLIAGTANLAWWDFWNINISGSTTTKAFTIQPCQDYDSKALSSPAFFVSCINGTGSNLYFYAINNVTRRTAPTPGFFSSRVAVGSYASPGNSIQSGGAERLENVAPRLMNAVKRGGAIWTAHSIQLGASGGAAARWYEFRTNTWPTSGAVTKRQESGFNGGSNFYYTFPSVAANQDGTMAMVFGRSGTTEFCGTRVSGRLSTRALNSLDGSVSLKTGEAYYVRKDSNGRNRWGDYLGAAVDPQGDFWFLGEYARAGNLWGTYIGTSRMQSLISSVPNADATTGACNVIPFGSTTTATWGNQKYQQLITAANLGNPGVVNICDLAFASCITARRHFDRIVVRLAQTNQSVLGTTFSANLDANLVTVLSKSNYEWNQVANQWSQIGFDRSYQYDASRGSNLVIEIEVRGAQAFTSSTAFPGHHTDALERLFAYNWTTTPPATGTRSTTAGLKVQVLKEAADLHSFGVGCQGSNGRTPLASFAGTGRLGTNYSLTLSNALPSASTFISVGLLPRRFAPLDLGVIGAPGCMWNFNNDITLVGTCNTSGLLSVNLPVPSTAPSCARVFFQFFPLDRRANPLGMTTSNYIRLLTGY